MTTLSIEAVERGYFLSNLRKEPQAGDPLCSCGKFKSRCSYTVSQDKNHTPLSFDQIQQYYFDWLYLHGGLLIEHSMENLK